MTTRTLSRGSKARPFAFPSPDEFRQWVEKQPLDAEGRPYVGTSGDPVMCPVALFLSERWPNVRVHVSLSDYKVASRSAEGTLDLPHWARAFVEIIDHPAGRYLRGSRAISRDEALKALDVVSPRR